MTDATRRRRTLAKRIAAGYVDQPKMAAAALAGSAAGTGQLARLFTERGKKVYLIEPEPAMRQVATAVLSYLPSIDVRPGFAEEIPLADGAVDLIVISTISPFPPNH
jgi:SAM-dependent methyltransferase